MSPPLSCFLPWRCVILPPRPINLPQIKFCIRHVWYPNLQLGYIKLEKTNFQVSTYFRYTTFFCWGVTERKQAYRQVNPHTPQCGCVRVRGSLLDFSHTQIARSVWYPRISRHQLKQISLQKLHAARLTLATALCITRTYIQSSL